MTIFKQSNIQATNLTPRKELKSLIYGMANETTFYVIVIYESRTSNTVCFGPPRTYINTAATYHTTHGMLVN